MNSMFTKSDVNTILDIGSGNNMFNKNYETTTIDISRKSDIKQNLNKNQKLPFSNNSFDLVVANQILEHLTNVEKIIKEIKRISKKYIFIGLPNERVIDQRIKFLLGMEKRNGYLPYDHKHRFRIKDIDKFINRFFTNQKLIKKENFGSFSFIGIFPYFIRDILANIKPSLFSKEQYYLLKKKTKRRRMKITLKSSYNKICTNLLTIINERFIYYPILLYIRWNQKNANIVIKW